MLKAMRYSSKKIAIFIVAALLINSSPLTYSQTLWQQTQAGLAKGLKAIASKLPELVQSAASKINASVKEKLKQIKDVAPTIIIPKLLENLEKLGQKVGSISSCMINGTCSNQERAAFIATAVTILALTAALIGFTITLAATSKEVDEQVIKVSEEVKGWSPKAIFTRLENAMAQFKQSLTSMQTCLLKRQCTKTQKKVLYATAGTIAALATIAVGVGVGSYVYAQYQEKQWQAETPSEIMPEKVEDKKPSTIATIKASLQELAQDWKSKIKETITPMQAYFQSHVIEKGTNKLQETAAKIQEFLQEQTTAAKEALSATSAKVKEELTQKAHAAYEKAKELAQQFIAELQATGKSFLELALEQILNIQLTYIEPALKNIQEYTNRTLNAINPLQNVRIQTQIINLTNELNTLIEKAAQLSGQWQESIKQIVERATWKASHITPTWLGGKTTEQINQEALQKYPLATTADEIWNSYPKLVEKVNDLKLGGPGIIIENFTKLAAQLLDWTQALNTAAGKVGKVIISKQLADALQELRNHLLSLGQNIRTTLTIKPILSQPPQTTAAALIEALRGYVWRVGFGLTNRMMEHLNNITVLYEDVVTPAIDIVKAKNDHLMYLINNIASDLKTELMNKIKENPLINTARAPIILAHAFGKIVSQLKGIINDILTKTGIIIEGVSAIIDEAKPMSELVNTAVGGEFINPGIINGLNAIKENVLNIKKTINNMMQGVTESVQVPAA